MSAKVKCGNKNILNCALVSVFKSKLWHCDSTKFTSKYREKTRESKYKQAEVLTAWVASEDISSDFIIDEDEEGVGEGTEPPTGPDGWTDRKTNTVTTPM